MNVIRNNFVPLLQKQPTKKLISSEKVCFNLIENDYN